MTHVPATNRIQNAVRLVLGASACAIGLSLATASAAAPPEHVPAKHNRGDDWAPGHIIVQPRAGLPAQALERIFAAMQGKAERIGQSDLYVVHIPVGSEQAAVAQLKRNVHIQFAALDHKVDAALTPNDPYFGSQWHLPNVGAPLAWNSTQGAGVTIAILDTGVNPHSDLNAAIVPGWDVVLDIPDTPDLNNHGSWVMGTAAATTGNGLGVSGVAGQAKAMPVKITPDFYSSTFSMYVTAGLVYAADHGARVANVSYQNLPDRPDVVAAAQYMKDKGGLVVVSAGNTGTDLGFAYTPTMIPVSATDSKDQLVSLSSFGDYVAVAAPGVNIWSTNKDGGYDAVAGTSFSSPLTAGVIALMMSANPALSNTEIEQLLFATAKDLGDPGKDVYFGHGRVDAAAAVQAAINATPFVDTEAPNASISNPLGGATVSGLVPVDVNANDNVGVSRVELRVGGTTVATDNNAPFAFSWDSTGMPNGMANLVAVAFDAAGNSAASNTVSVNVANITTPPPPVADTTPPQVMIVDPVAGAVSGSVSITVNASDDSGAAGIQLAIFVDGSLLASGSGSSLSASWNTKSKSVSTGAHTIMTTATDAAGNTSSASVTVDVVKGGGSGGGSTGGGGKGKNR